MLKISLAFKLTECLTLPLEECSMLYQTSVLADFIMILSLKLPMVICTSLSSSNSKIIINRYRSPSPLSYHYLGHMVCLQFRCELKLPY